jgi:3-deoxy-7-phosphoheptulonate synthase
MQSWSPSSWQRYPCQQAIEYADPERAQDILRELQQRPALVTRYEIETLKQHIASASRGHAFILQGGDCAESFAHSNIPSQVNLLLEMSRILLDGLRKPIVPIGRIAGQYAKPRSQLLETRGEHTLPAYRGDIINQHEFTLSARTPNPELLLRGYDCSALALQEIRGIHDHFFTSHEALHLPYEQALTRQESDGRWYNVSTHFPWIGMRTALLDHAHLEYTRGIANPIAIKIGPSMTTSTLKRLVEHQNPNREPGKLTLMTRLGAAVVQQKLPDLIKAAQDTQIPIAWICDPMHGNTHDTLEGYKTRAFDDITREYQETLTCHDAHQSHLAGVHFELTGDHVTECTGGSKGLNESDLSRAYKSLVDPRLNINQALEIALLIVNSARRTRCHSSSLLEPAEALEKR